MSCITADNLYKYYGSVKAIDGISLNVDYGKVFEFLGPNGAGKTTTIKIFTKLIQPSSGIVKDVRHRRHKKCQERRVIDRSQKEGAGSKRVHARDGSLVPR